MQLKRFDPTQHAFEHYLDKFLNKYLYEKKIKRWSEPVS